MDDEPPRISRYRPSSAIDGLIHDDDAATRRLRCKVVEALRTATTDTFNRFIEETGAADSPANAISSDGYYAGLVEGFVEAIYHDVASLVVSGCPLDELLSTLSEIQSATTDALGDLQRQLTGTS